MVRVCLRDSEQSKQGETTVCAQKTISRLDFNVDMFKLVDMTSA